MKKEALPICSISIRFIIISFLFGCLYLLFLGVVLNSALVWSAGSGIIVIYCLLLTVIFWGISVGFIYVDIRDYKQAKRAELRDIHSKLCPHPDATFEQSVTEAAKGSRYWKIGILVKMWKDLYDNACFRVYR